MKTDNTKHEIMDNLLYLLAIILITMWAIGFIGYSAGGLIHILLFIAIVAIFIRIIQGKNPI